MCTDENNDKKNTNLPPPLPTHLIIFIKCIEKNTVNIKNSELTDEEK